MKRKGDAVSDGGTRYRAPGCGDGDRWTRARRRGGCGRPRPPGAGCV